jgi:putative ABC transport system permease protein
MNLTVIGVVADARFRSVSKPLEPILFRMEQNDPRWLVARYTGNPQAAMDQVRQVFRRMRPDQAFDGEFSDAIMARTYKRMDARAQMFAIFAGLAVAIGCLGLFGLAAFTAERRTKEIGIRKVLGARSWDVARLLVWQFTRPVVVANLLAWPVAWWVMRDWLNQYDARVALGPVPFLLAGGLALLIAVATIGGHALRIARTNPIFALRYE